MNNIVIYILIGLIVILFIGLIFLGIYLIKSNKNKVTNQSGLDDKTVAILLAEQVHKITNEVGEQIAAQNTKLSEFNEENARKSEQNKNQLVNQIDNKFNSMNSDVTKKFQEMNDSVDQRFNKMDKGVSETFISLNKQIEDRFKNVNETVESKLKEINNNVGLSLDKGFKDSQEHLDKVNEAVGKMISATANIDALNNQVTSLNNVLSNTQSRGRFGEIQLETILANVFGDTHGIYDTQYAGKEFGDKRPDAVVFITNGDERSILCIDSKFSFLAYSELFSKNPNELVDKDFTSLKTALKSQIKEIAEKYIIENVTYPYALMFIPNDSIYFFIQSSNILYRDVIEYAKRMNVVLVSPSMLQPVLLNIKQLNINQELGKNIKEVIKQFNEIKVESDRLKERYEVVEKNIGTLTKNYGEVGKTVKKITNKSDEIINQSLKKGIVQKTDIALEIKENEED